MESKNLMNELMEMLVWAYSQGRKDIKEEIEELNINPKDLQENFQKFFIQKVKEEDTLEPKSVEDQILEVVDWSSKYGLDYLKNEIFNLKVDLYKLNDKVQARIAKMQENLKK
jgi:isopropylmalate/homocitrate/citramalate synthase|tara:strand:- start:1336 stop:1674 length:339 start_codon:yes stop_codon:yes gene_type:complete